MRKIYLALPYTSPVERTMETRARISTVVAGELMLEGNVVFAPITQCRPIAKAVQLPHSWEFWKKIDTEFIKWCDDLMWLKLPGWKKSTGLNAEFKIAEDLGKNIVEFHVDRLRKIEAQIIQDMELSYR